MIQNKDTHNVQEEKIIIDPIKKKALNLIQRLNDLYLFGLL